MVAHEISKAITKKEELQIDRSMNNVRLNDLFEEIGKQWQQQQWQNKIRVTLNA